MKNKRRWWLLAAFLLLGFAAWWYVLRTPDPRMAALAEERQFAVPATEQIGRIFLARRDGETINLERAGSEWRYNGKWKVRPSAMENLLDAIRRIEIQYKPPQAAVPNMVRNLAAEGIKVIVYHRSGRELCTYYVGGSTPDERGTFVIREGYDQPYVAYLPGWEGNLRFRYNLKGEDWRDRAVFAENPDAIQELRIEYPLQRSMSFILEKKKSGFDVRPFFPTTRRIVAPLSPGAAEAFLVGFESLSAEAFRNDYTHRDSVRQLIPFAIISLRRADGSRKEVRFFPIQPAPVEVDPKTEQLPGNNEIERFFASDSAGDFFLVQNRVFKKVFWGYPFFFSDIKATDYQ